MKVLHVITSLRTGGAERLMVDLLPRFRENVVKPDLLIFDGTETPFKRELEQSGIIVYHSSIGDNVYNPRHFFKLLELMCNYDIIHTHNTAPQFFAAISKIFGTKAKLVTTEHNTSNRRRKWSIFRTIDRWMYDKYDTVICISDQAETNLRKFIKSSKAKILTIYNGVNLDRCINAEPSIELKKYLPEDVKTILMVAGFRWEKDQDTLIKAMKLLPANFHLFFAGTGVRMDECKQLAKHLNVADRVHFLGMRTDVPNLLQAADYIALSSHFEGLSLSSVEGMSVGKPFLASDVDGLREVVKGYGILFPHHDSEVFANEILKFDCSEEYYKQIGERCAKRAKDFDISKMVDSYIEVYNNLMQQNG